jgi:hypothetical protein
LTSKLATFPGKKMPPLCGAEALLYSLGGGGRTKFESFLDGSSGSKNFLIIKTLENNKLQLY